MPVFVILHYLSFEMTVQCMETLEKTFSGKPYHAVIVDNASPNGSGAKLKEKYSDSPNCTVLLSPENLGFARGNNLGYQYAAKNLSPEYVVVMNNDVLVEDPEFFTKIRNIYEETDFYVLGPDIYACAAGVHQSPMSKTGYTRQQVEKIIRQRKWWLRFYPLHFSWNRLVQILKKTAKRLLGRKPRPYENPLAKIPRLENPVLHGSCYIFSRNFLRVREEAFDPGTFLYFEEDILHFLCKKNQWRIIYDNSISVTHLEDVSTNLAFRSEYKKQKMKYRNLIQSASVLLRHMQEEAAE